MDFKDLIKQIGDRVIKLKDQIQTEEATKNAFIMPFLQALGYDVFNPIEVVPELPLDAQSRSVLMEIIEDRHGKSSTIITSQIPINKWHEIIGEQTIADAILDRIVHDAHRLDMKGESLRKKRNVKTNDDIDLENLLN